MSGRARKWLETSLRNYPSLPHCVTCGRFTNPSTPGTSYRMVIPSDYWNGPDDEQYRCALCTDKIGPLQPSHGAADWTAGIVNIDDRF